MTYYTFHYNFTENFIFVIDKLCTPTHFPHTGKTVEEKSVITIFLASVAADLIIVAAVLISYRRPKTLACNYYWHNWKRPFVDRYARTWCFYTGLKTAVQNWMSISRGYVHVFRCRHGMDNAVSVRHLFLDHSIHTPNLQSRVDLCRYHSNWVSSGIP